jgi:hypothetical protein
MEKFWQPVQHPSGGDKGEVALVCYTLDGDTLTVVDETGTPLRGKQGIYQHRLKDGEDPKRIAGRLMRQFRTARHGDSNFYRPIAYPKLGIV